MPSGLLANASRKCRSRSDQWPGEKSGLYSFKISCMAKKPTFLRDCLGPPSHSQLRLPSPHCDRLILHSGSDRLDIELVS